MEIDKEMLKGYIVFIILSLLRESPLYGYELAKKVNERSQGKFDLKEGTMYLALKRMENSRLIRSFWDDSSSGGGRRKYYEILPSGLEHLSLKIEEWNFMKSIIDLFIGGSL